MSIADIRRKLYNTLQDMIEKLKQYQDKIEYYTDQLHDVRFVGLMTFALMILLISWSGAKAIDTNYRLQKQISQLEQQNAVHRLANDNLKLQNQYFNTDQYLELSARQNFGLAQPGEKQLIVPKTVALAHAPLIENAEQVQTVQTRAKQPSYQRNFQAWMNFFLHRQQVEID